jgi:hypothetical protein
MKIQEVLPMTSLVGKCVYDGDVLDDSTEEKLNDVILISFTDTTIANNMH